MPTKVILGNLSEYAKISFFNLFINLFFLHGFKRLIV